MHTNIPDVTDEMISVIAQLLRKWLWLVPTKISGYPVIFFIDAFHS